MYDIRLQRRATIIPPPHPTFEAVSWSVDAQGNALVLFIRALDVDAVTDYDKRYGYPSRLDQPIPAWIVRHDGQEQTAIQLHGMAVGRPMIQPFPDGSILVCGRYCRRKKNGTAERNAQVFASDGMLTEEMTLGTDITQLQVDRHGAIWAGYGDMGIFGAHGWDEPDVEPIGIAGLVRFDCHGLRTWRLPPPSVRRISAHVRQVTENAASPWPRIDHVYAMNVSDSSVWLYPLGTGSQYEDFPLIQIARANPNSAPHVWFTEIDPQTTISGAKAVAVHGSQVVFYGGYPGAQIRDAEGQYVRDASGSIEREVGNTYRCLFGHLGQNEQPGRNVIGDRRQARLLTEPGIALGDGPTLHRAVGRGSQLHFFVGDSWYTLDLATVNAR